MSKAIVKNSLLSSSINIKNISRSVNSFANAFTKSQRIATDIQKQTKEANDFKSKLIRSDDSYFRKRQENIKRKDREDEIEASTVGGAIRRTGSVASKSTRGFLGRILDTIGVLFVGWMLTTLPALNKSIVGFIGRVSTLMRALNGMVDSIINNLTFFESNLKNSDEAIQQIDFTEDERYMKEELDSTDDSFRKLTRDLFSTFETFNDPRSMGIPRNSWDEVASTPLNEIVPPQLLPEESEESEVVDTKKGETEGKTPPLPETDKEKGDTGERTPPSTTRDEVKTDEIESKGEPEEESTANVVEGTNTTKELTPKGKVETNDNVSKKEDSNEEFKLEPGEDSGFEMFKDGGIIKGKSHEEGGENINVEGGEAIIPKKNVEKYTPEFINRIIKGDADKVTKLRASRSLLEKLVEQHKEENMGLIKVDEFNKLQEQTVGKLKEHLAQSQGIVEGIKQQIESTDLGGLSSEEAVKTQKNLISSIIEPIQTKRPTIGRKRKKSRIVPVPVSSSKPSPAPSSPASAPINSGGSSSQISIKTDEGIWGKLQTLELHYT
jgi:hypothetical protein